MAVLPLASPAVDPRAVHGRLDLLDAGFAYQLARRIPQGEVPYRDFFTRVTPLAFSWQALLVAVFGPGLLGHRAVRRGDRHPALPDGPAPLRPPLRLPGRPRLDPLGIPQGPQAGP